MNSILLAFGALDQRLATQCRALSLRRHEVDVRIGVHDFERNAAQRVWFDVDLCIKLDHAPAAKDHISQTVDYVSFVKLSQMKAVVTTMNCRRLCAMPSPVFCCKNRKCMRYA